MDASNVSLERQILLELLYERVRASVNLCQLVVLEQELERSIERVLETSDMEPEHHPGDGEGLARGYVEQAWRRLEAEWQRLRHDLDGAFDDDLEHEASTP